MEEVQRLALAQQIPADRLHFECFTAGGAISEEGLCRSCEVTLLAGEADHRDYVLSDEERAANRSILICVSRARSSTLVPDV
ncbi:2Fe-2S iron-sulfur cluster-binding protein [Serratia proteamaculans]|jgi:vanillate O-demethylase ferredoxin subunit|uniref:2Fe-2S iron-sulfur cluster-binding protein n=1 Tax=Serratia proteamaculans TaxID=28151 RepID=UPI0039AFD45E